MPKMLAGEQWGLATTLAVGIGASAASGTSTTLDYELDRQEIDVSAADLVNGRVVLKATMPVGSTGTIYEVGLFHGIQAQVASARVLGVTDALSTWTNATLSATNSRITGNTRKIDFVTSGTTNAEMADFTEDLSDFTTGAVVIAFNATTNLSSARLRLGTDSSNYYEFVISSPAVGYNIRRLTMASATVTGTPSWGALSYLAIRPSATAGGGGSMYVDGIRVEQVGGTLIARSVLGTPFVLDPTIETNIEYALDVDVL